MVPRRCTYRVQLRPGFGFREAAGIVGQLADLGVSHLYLSPCLEAVPGSTHGYDVIDPSRVSEDLGGEEGFHDLVDAARRRGIGLLLDIVPNHMAIDPRNEWWWDVLENGRSSVHALAFDVSWDPPEPRLKEIVLVPVLADHYGRELERGALRLEREEGRIVLRYAERYFPIAPETLDAILGLAGRDLGSGDVIALAGEAGRLPDLIGASRSERVARHRAKEAILGRLALLCADADVAAAIDHEIARLNGDVDALDALLRRQHYRIAHWRTAAREVDYRRFFDINELVALRTEDPDVFDAVHERIAGWLRAGAIDGVRVDHVDGLRDPRGYLERLRETAGEEAWIVVEKIVHPDERLRPSWPVEGTTGYEAAALIDRLYVDPEGIASLTRTYQQFTGERRSFTEIALEAKHEVMGGPLAADVERVTALLVLVCERHRRHRDHTRDDLRQAVRELASATAVYRIYARPGAPPEDEDSRWLDGAIGIARRRRPDIDPELLRFLRALLLFDVTGDVEAELAMRFQQLTAPVAAKGIEDTAFYRYARLVALNEVGGDPSRPTASLDAFHRANRERLARWPYSFIAGSTHDSKRSDDVRARIALLAELPDAWAEAVTRWSRHNERHREGDLPDREMELLLYQTLVGAHPLPLDRALAYMEKAAREAKRHTSWTAPNERYERALAGFIRGIVGDPVFTADLAAFAEPLVAHGRTSSLARTLLRLTVPGVPDIYQGDELWQLSLVDPDSRRPVDHGLRARLLRELEDLDPSAVLARADEGLPKLHVIRTALRVRGERPDAFAGGYQPLAVEGERAEHAVAYVRGDAVAVVVPRLVLRLAGDWRDARVHLPDGDWCERMTSRRIPGGPVALADLLGPFPVALLTRE